MMIMLVFVQADVNPPSPQVEPNNVFSKIKCFAKCGLECAPQLSLSCFKTCTASCRKTFNDVPYDCINACGLTNSVDINTGMHDFTFHDLVYGFSYY
uniref:Uncharacterized protein n=1 Tax=Cajanus cajan TaxID=3821 RepID=A0A151UEP2_CAJCA